MSNPFERGRDIETIKAAIVDYAGDDYPLYGLLCEFMGAIERDSKAEIEQLKTQRDEFYKQAWDNDRGWK